MRYFIDSLTSIQVLSPLSYLVDGCDAIHLGSQGLIRNGRGQNQSTSEKFDSDILNEDEERRATDRGMYGLAHAQKSCKELEECSS